MSKKIKKSAKKTNPLLSQDTINSLKTFKDQGLRIANSTVRASVSTGELALSTAACTVETIEIITERANTFLPKNKEKLENLFDSLLEK